MRILIDGDACPVIDITEETAREYDIELIIIVDITHQIKSDYGQVICVDKENQAVDMAIYNRCQEGDIIITQDYGLAALVLGKRARVINQFGLEYTENNIDRLLMSRHVKAKMRRAGIRHETHGKRTEDDDINFKRNLIKIIKRILSRRGC